MEIIIRNGSETGQTRLPKAGYIRTTDRSETSNPTAKVYKPICPSETRPYIKKTMPLPKAARSIAPESNRGICARPSPRRTACNGNETNRHGRSLLSSADFPTDRRDIRFNGNRTTMPRSRTYRFRMLQK